jgi:hypothetical protein
MNLVRHPAYHYTKATPVSGPSPLPVTASMAGEPPRTAGRISPSSLDSLLLDVPSTIARPGSSKSKRMFEVDDPPDPTDVQVQSPQVRRNSIRFSDMNEIAQMAVPSIPGDLSTGASSSFGRQYFPNKPYFCLSSANAPPGFSA